MGRLTSRNWNTKWIIDKGTKRGFASCFSRSRLGAQSRYWWQIMATSWVLMSFAHFNPATSLPYPLLCLYLLEQVQASLIPSPTMATILYCCCSWTMCWAFCSGSTSRQPHRYLRFTYCLSNKSLSPVNSTVWIPADFSWAIACLLSIF